MNQDNIKDMSGNSEFNKTQNTKKNFVNSVVICVVLGIALLLSTGISIYIWQRSILDKELNIYKEEIKKLKATIQHVKEERMRIQQEVEFE